MNVLFQKCKTAFLLELPDTQGIFLKKLISIEKMTTSLPPNLNQIYAFSHRLYKKKLFTNQSPLMNNELPIIIHYYKGDILGHKVDFSLKQPH